LAIGEYGNDISIKIWHPPPKMVTRMHNRVHNRMHNRMHNPIQLCLQQSNTEGRAGKTKHAVVRSAPQADLQMFVATLATGDLSAAAEAGEP
jgi:hypothetical protein